MMRGKRSKLVSNDLKYSIVATYRQNQADDTQTEQTSTHLGNGAIIDLEPVSHAVSTGHAFLTCSR